MHVLILTPQYYPDYGPSAPIYTALSEDLARLGHDVTVVTAFPNYTGSASSNPYAGKLFQEERCNGVHIIRTYIYNVPKTSLWKRLLYHGSYNIFSTLAALRLGRSDVMIADSPTLWSGLPLMVKAVIPGVPFIYVVHDIYPDVLFRLGVLRNPSLLNFIGKVENFFYKKSIQISVLSEGFRQNLLQKGIPDEKITIIPACVDTDFVMPLSKENKFLDEWNLRGKFVVLYAGNIGLSQGLDSTLQAAKLLTDYPEIVFVIVGDGATKPGLETMAQEMGLTNVKFFPFQPREEVPLIYSLADISLVSLKRNIVVESVPSKTYTILASGRPIVATVDQGTEVGSLLCEVNCGVCTEPENPQMMAQVILRLYKDEALRLEMGRNGRQYVVDHYSRKTAANRYNTIIQQHFDKGKK